MTLVKGEQDAGFTIVSDICFCYPLQMFPFEIVGPVTEIETIAVGNAIREVARLRKMYGLGRWRKRKGAATLQLPNGEIVRAEIHWYEATGFDRKEYKIKQILE